MMRVFLSYSHDNGDHKAQVHDFADRLAAEGGITVVLDRDTGPGGPDEGWPAWSERQVREADRVLIACSEPYARRYEGNDDGSARGKGTVAEARAIQQFLYDAKGKNPRFRVVLLSQEDDQHIPLQLRGYQWFSPREVPSYQQLVSWLKASSRNASETLAAVPAWPRPDNDFKLTLADRRPHFDCIRSALSGRSSNRIFLLRGDSASGKTEFMNELSTYADHVKVPWMRFDFKGARPIGDFFQAALLQLGAKRLPKLKAAHSERPLLELVEDLEAFTVPVLFFFDTYEKASEDARSWLETNFLPCVRSLLAGIVVIGGQSVPNRDQYPWRSLAETHSLEPISNPEDWREYVERVHNGRTLELHQFETLTRATGGRPGNLKELLTTLIDAETARRAMIT